MDDNKEKPKCNCLVCGAESDSANLMNTSAYVNQLKQELTASQEQVKVLRELIKEASDYLDINKYANICSTSILHDKFKAVLVTTPETGK